MENEAKAHIETVHNLSFQSNKPRTQKLEGHKHITSQNSRAGRQFRK